ncbi:MAG: fluoride efflux transporter CrcB, partial [Methylovulum sp.]|nr:fluoride efflux transporter CrcB [Methylovulum sp.]
ALLISVVTSLLLPKVPMAIERQLALVIIMGFAYLGLSGLYVLLYLLEHGYSYPAQAHAMLLGFASNTVACALVMWLGWWAVRRLGGV